MYIEFIGLPGSGKTTLRDKLLSSLQDDGEESCISSEEAFLEVSKDKIDRVLRYPLRYLNRSAALKLAGLVVDRSRMQFEAQNRFLASHGAALEAFLTSATFHHMSKLDRQRVLGNFLNSGALWQCTNTMPMRRKTILFEEGLIQKSFMFVDHSPREKNDRDKILCYLENIPQPDLVIHVSASTQISWKRMLSRPDGLTDRLKHADEETISYFLTAAQAHLDVVVEWLTESDHDNFMILNSEDNTTVEFDAIKDRIRKLQL